MPTLRSTDPWAPRRTADSTRAGLTAGLLRDRRLLRQVQAASRCAAQAPVHRGAWHRAPCGFRFHGCAATRNTPSLRTVRPPRAAAPKSQNWRGQLCWCDAKSKTARPADSWAWHQKPAGLYPPAKELAAPISAALPDLRLCARRTPTVGKELG